MSLAFVFPGQGSQYVGMGKTASPLAQDLFSQAEEVLSLPLKKLCLEGPEEELKRTEITQPAIFTVSAIILAQLKEKGLTPVMAAGHSLGEYGALYAAGALSFTDTVKILHLRGKFMQQAVPQGKGAMAAVLGLDAKTIKEICQEAGVAAANFNSPEQTVISGEKEKVEAAGKLLKEKGAKRIIPLQVSAPFHSPLMIPAQEKLKTELARIKINDAAFPVIANVTAQPVTSAEEIRKLLVEQVTAPVRWVETIENMIKAGADNFLEAGPGKVLCGLIKKINSNVQTTSGEEATV